jgi:WhiB family redox-sensing transcriptional regulator
MRSALGDTAQESLTRWLMMPAMPDIDDAFRQMLSRPDWQSDAACRGQGSRGWVGDGDGAPYAAQKAVCAECPVREPCLAYALANKSLMGCWGGTTESERRELRRRLAAA